MSNATRLQIAIVTGLAAAGVVATDPPGERLSAGPLACVLGFGVLNVLLSLPGTLWARAISTIAAFIVLMFPEFFVLFGTAAVVLWPPAIAAGWSIARGQADSLPLVADAAAIRARVAVAVTIAAIAAASLGYRVLVMEQLDQSAALFVGLPAFIAIAVVFAVSPETATGAACKAMTVGLLTSALFLGEGILCVIMSAPLFYLIAVAVAGAMKVAHLKRQSGRLVSSVALLAVLPMSLEGVAPAMTVPRDEWVVVTRVVRVAADDVARAVMSPPRFDRRLPMFLRAGFPWPVATAIEHDATGARWIVRMRGGEMRLDGMEPRTGDLILKLEEARPGLARWSAIADNSHMTHYLRWREAIVQWEAAGGDTTRVTWSIRYERRLDPAWYFGPWERYAVRLAAVYLVDAVAMP